MFKNREVVKKDGYTFSIMQFIGNGKWNLVREYSNALGGNKIFNSREECIDFINRYILQQS